MTVTTTPNTEYCGNNLQAIFYKDALAKQLARELVVSQAEGVVEMLCDGYDDQIKNHADVKIAITMIKDGTKDMLADYIRDLQSTLETYIDQLDVKCVNSMFNDEGVIDIGILVEYPVKGE